jgi:hypothetical protein
LPVGGYSANRPSVTRSTLRSGALLVALALGCGGCGRAKTPEEAYARFSQAVTAGDPERLFDALDQPSRWAWMTVQKSHREAYDIILSNYPEGAERTRQLRRFERGAVLGSARQLFVEEVGRAALPGLAPMVGQGARFERALDGTRAEAVLPSGARVALRKGENGSWGFAGLGQDAEERQRRALSDVEVVRTSAADYERAAARNMK